MIQSYVNWLQSYKIFFKEVLIWQTLTRYSAHFPLKWIRMPCMSSAWIINQHCLTANYRCRGTTSVQTSHFWPQFIRMCYRFSLRGNETFPAWEWSFPCVGMAARCELADFYPHKIDVWQPGSVKISPISLISVHNYHWWRVILGRWNVKFMLKVSPLQHFCNTLTLWYSVNSEPVADVAVENKNFVMQWKHSKVVACDEKRQWELITTLIKNILRKVILFTNYLYLCRRIANKLLSRWR